MTFACVEMMGAVVSWTVTVKLPFVVLLCKSVAEQLTVVIPRANIVPDAGAQITATDPSTTSDEIAENVAVAPRVPVASMLMFAGRVRIGAVVSVTVTVKLPLAVLLRKSVAEQFTEVTPTRNVLPEAGEQVTETEPSTRSEAEAEYVVVVPDELVASVVMLADRLSVGGVVS